MSERITKRSPFFGYENNIEEIDELTIAQDKEFLLQLNEYPIKSVNIKITSFSKDLTNLEIEKTDEIIGRVTGGNINVDGSSAIRRTCNLSLIALDTDNIIKEEYWAYNTEFKLEIGLDNYINPEYEDIIWFNMGRYVITSFNINKSTTTTNVSISGKDKMCRLNGEISGNIPIQTDFGTVEIIQDNGVIKIEKIKIIDIIKNAIREYGLENSDHIIIRDLNKIQGYELWEYKGDSPMYYFIKIIEDKPTVVNLTLDDTIKIKVGGKSTTLKNFNGQFYSYNTLDPNYNNNATQIKFPNDDFTIYYLAKIEYGDTAGYHQTPLVYNGDLILNVGESVTSLLDKLKNMLGEFEYFYDLDGRFVFQQKKTYIKKLFQPPMQNNETNAPENTEEVKYEYEFNDKTLFTSIGKTPNVANIKNDFSIWGNRKGISGQDLPIHVRYAIHEKPVEYNGYSAEDYDWRELIYQMAKDYNQTENKDNMERTGYEQYYSDFIQFWRQIYNPEDAEQFYDNSAGDMKYWNKDIYANPGTLNFWIDFLDPTENEIFRQYSINAIKSRTKSLNDSQVKAISYKETPELLFILPGENIDNVSYTPIQVQEDMRQLFNRSTQGVSAIDRANEIINTNVAAAEGLNITAIPIYYLQPNTRIKIEGYGDYTLDRISYSLSYNGTMSMSCNKIIEDLV